MQPLKNETNFQEKKCICENMITLYMDDPHFLFAQRAKYISDDTPHPEMHNVRKVWSVWKWTDVILSSFTSTQFS